MAKKTKSKEAGYVPFTRDDINLEDGRNSKAEELFLQMLEIPKKVIKKKNKGKDDTIVDDDFYPTTPDEVLRMEAMMVKVEEAIDDPSDREFMDNVAYMKDVLTWSKKRHWEFAWWIVICVAIVAVYFFYRAGKSDDRYEAIENWSAETMNEKYAYEVDMARKGLEYSKEQLAAATTPEAVKDATEALERAEKRVKETAEMGPEGYRDSLTKYKGNDKSSRVWSGVWCLIWLCLYVIAERPYGYMISRRRTELKIYSGLRKALFGVAGGMVGFAGAMKVTETVTKYSDGSKSTSSDAGAVVAMQVVILLAAAVLVLVAARIVIVIATLMGFLRNYDLIKMGKQAFNKGRELTSKKKAS